MVKVTIVAGQFNDDMVGEFEFADLPCVGHEVCISWPADPTGNRIFDVREITHYAAGLTGTPEGDGPRTVLRCDEIG